MKQYTILIITALTLLSCKKDNYNDADVYHSTPPDAVLRYNDPIPALDVDGDGIRDAALAVYLYMEDGWAIEHYYIYPEDHADIAVQNGADAFAFERNKGISANLGPGGKWHNNRAVLFEKKVRDDETVFVGNWKEAQDKFLGIRIKKEGKYYYGWLKMTQRKNAGSEAELIITRTAIKTKPDIGIKTIDK